MIVQKCKCDFGVLYVKYFFDVTGHTKTRLNTRSSATSIFFMNCLSATTSVAFSVLDYGKLYLEFLLVIVQKCKCDFGVLYVRYSLM